MFPVIIIFFILVSWTITYNLITKTIYYRKNIPNQKDSRMNIVIEIKSVRS